MADDQPQRPDRIGLIGAVTSYLGFFVLTILVIEAILGAVVLSQEGDNQRLALYGFIGVVILLVVIVSLFAFLKPDALLNRAAASEPPFASKLSGWWWEKISPAGESAISTLEIRWDRASATLKLQGAAYDQSGKRTALWESLGCCVNANDGKLFYYWRGWYPNRPHDSYEGVGEITFNHDQTTIDRGVGFFSDSCVADIQSTTRRATDLSRCQADELAVVKGGESQQLAHLVQKKLSA